MIHCDSVIQSCKTSLVCPVPQQNKSKDKEKLALAEHVNVFLNECSVEKLVNVGSCEFVFPTSVVQTLVLFCKSLCCFFQS